MRRLLSHLLLLLLGAGAVLWFFYQRDMAEHAARLAGISKTVQTPFGLVEYAEREQGAPVLVIHGSGGGLDQA
jgi:2-hydroxy-6-oxonona-2,4-dienedioate hydrolase